MDSSEVEGKPKVLSCFFYDDVVCSYRKSETFGIMSRCFKCPHFKRFNREMDEEDAEIMDEIDREMRGESPYG